jgi:signal transduction histidine kinase
VSGGGGTIERKFWLLIVDDDVGLAANLQDILEAEGYSAAVAHDGQTALALCREKVFDLAIIDIRLPDMPGTKLMPELTKLSPGLDYIISTGYASLDSAIEAVGLRNIVAYETKPLNMSQVLAIIRQVAERRQAEARQKQLQQELYLSSRLAAIGELAAGVAHEINNPLTGILGFSQRLLRKSTDEGVRRDLERIHNEALRAAKVVDNLLTFARSREPKKEYTDINDILQKALELRAYELRTGNIEVITELAPDLPGAMVNFHQIEEVFVNIVLNAEQVMAEANRGGRLTIKTQQRQGCIMVSFADDGPGIADDDLDRLFDPFFTTRGATGGTGLGLSICHGIVAEHGGRIYAKSSPGKGATFFVELPLTREYSSEGEP